MRHPKIIIASIGLAVVAAAGGITAAAAGTSPTSSAPSAGQSASATVHTASATVHTASATVGGKTETILVNAAGRPLYFYRPDTATKSLVAGGLAQLWPPLTSAAPAGAGLTGKLTVLHDAHGDQVSYKGHPLYTFADDHAGQVTGQGVEDFFVATPGLAPITTSTPAPAAPAAPAGGTYGY
jgi:predicted lipoprotein with Yx(FWY)xxD motif